MSSTVIDSLHRDHVNLAQLSRAARRVLEDIEKGEHSDFELLEDIMRYVSEYPDVHHHPNEDIVFELLRERAPETVGRIDAILDEHARIIEQAKEFLTVIESIEEDAMFERARVVRAGLDYFDALDRHMDTEETILFPAARKHLNAADWEKVESRIDRVADPLFGESVEREYSGLRKRIELHC